MAKRTVVASKCLIRALDQATLKTDGGETGPGMNSRNYAVQPFGEMI
jgi:hypothetical protein